MGGNGGADSGDGGTNCTGPPLSVGTSDMGANRDGRAIAGGGGGGACWRDAFIFCMTAVRAGLFIAGGGTGIGK